MPHGITQCYLPTGRGDIHALTPAEAGTRLSDPGRMQSINQSIMLFRVVQVTKSLQDPLEVGNSLLGISDNVRE